MGLKDTVRLCDSDEGISPANKALLLSNDFDKFNGDIKSWLSCYYLDLNLIIRFNDDTSENLSRKAFLTSYPWLALTGGEKKILDCNAKVKDIANIDEKAFELHKCYIAAGFKL